MDYNLAAPKLVCAQLKHARETSPEPKSSLSLGGILFQRAWLQGILVSTPSDGAFILDDGTGLVQLSLSPDFFNRHWNTGMYVMVVGGVFVCVDQAPMIMVHKMVDLSPFPDREAMWYLEVIEAYKLFYQPEP